MAPLADTDVVIVEAVRSPLGRRNGGRVLMPSRGRLGEYVVSDYLRARRGRRRRAS